MNIQKLRNFINNRRPLRRRDQVIGLIAVTFILMFSYDFIRASTIVVKNTDTDIFSAKETTPPTPEPGDPETVCEYKEVLQENVGLPSDDDDIQENIGYQNNKVGLYIYAEVEEYADLAAELANSNGGDWGYVLIPYNVKDYDEARWGKLFMKLGEDRLIPIIQLWDLDLDDDKRDKQIEESAKFLNSLPWPIKHRYVSAYNEMNDAKFWKGDVDPEEYAEILDKTIDELKSLNDDFFIMNGAFNASARTGGDYLDAEIYMIRMNEKVPGIFKKLDGWASHPYPQPNFAGSPNGKGRDSIRAYEWELSVLQRRFGIDQKELPVFITETGWAHKESEALNNGERVGNYLDQYKVADNFRRAFESVWLKDDRVVAVTPFTVRYDPPHDHFSWITKNSSPYPQFTAIKDMEKVKGKPPVISYVKSKVVVCE